MYSEAQLANAREVALIFLLATSFAVVAEAYRLIVWGPGGPLRRGSSFPFFAAFATFAAFAAASSLPPVFPVAWRGSRGLLACRASGVMKWRSFTLAASVLPGLLVQYSYTAIPKYHKASKRHR